MLSAHDKYLLTKCYNILKSILFQALLLNPKSTSLTSHIRKQHAKNLLRESINKWQKKTGTRKDLREGISLILLKRREKVLKMLFQRITIELKEQKLKEQLTGSNRKQNNSKTLFFFSLRSFFFETIFHKKFNNVYSLFKLSSQARTLSRLKNHAKNRIDLKRSSKLLVQVIRRKRREYFVSVRAKCKLRSRLLQFFKKQSNKSKLSFCCIRYFPQTVRVYLQQNIFYQLLRYSLSQKNQSSSEVFKIIKKNFFLKLRRHAKEAIQFTNKIYYLNYFKKRHSLDKLLLMIKGNQNTDKLQENAIQLNKYQITPKNKLLNQKQQLSRRLLTAKVQQFLDRLQVNYNKGLKMKLKLIKLIKKRQANENFYSRLKKQFEGQQRQSQFKMKLKMNVFTKLKQNCRKGRYADRLYIFSLRALQKYKMSVVMTFRINIFLYFRRRFFNERMMLLIRFRLAQGIRQLQTFMLQKLLLQNMLLRLSKSILTRAFTSLKAFKARPLGWLQLIQNVKRILEQTGQ